VSGVTVTSVVRTTPEIAFRVFTEEIDAWWKLGPRFRVHAERKSTMRLEPRVGGRFLEVYDAAGPEREQDAFELGKVRVWEPPERVVFEMRGRDFKPDERTEVDVRFEPTHGGTRVTVHHTGWDGLPPGHPARHGHDNHAFTNMMGLWWADQLRAVRTFVDDESSTTCVSPSSC